MLKIVFAKVQTGPLANFTITARIGDSVYEKITSFVLQDAIEPLFNQLDKLEGAVALYSPTKQTIASEISYNPNFKPLLFSEKLGIESLDSKFDITANSEIAELPTRPAIMVFRPRSQSLFRSNKGFVLSPLYVYKSKNIRTCETQKKFTRTICTQ